MFNLPFLTKKVFKVLLLHFLLLFMSTQMIAQDTDGDGIANATDPDDDNDGIPDENEEFLLHSNYKPLCDASSVADFRQPANLISGENNEVGAVYRIENVYTGIDVLVEIEQLENVSGLTLDNNDSNESSFQPITVAENTEDGQESFVQYKFTFVSTGTTNPVVIPSLFANVADIDGNTGLNGDVIYFANHSSYTLEEPTSMNLTNSVYDNEINWTKIVAGTEEVDGIDTLDKSAMVTPKFSNFASFHMRVGFVSRGDHGNITRPARIDFTCIANYSTPSTYIVDFDEDGVRNTLDLDSDNDGISDATESGLSGNEDADLRDTDGDDNPDFMDLDSDGDGITDLIEGQTTAGFINLAFSDTDGDGIDNAFDTDEGFGPIIILEPVNTEGGDNEDYRDLDSDNDNKEDRIEGWDSDNDGTANTVPLNTDADFDGLDDGYDVNVNAVNPGNDQTPELFPNTGGTSEKDWRDPYIDNPIAYEDFIEASEDTPLDLNKVFENDVISDDGPSATAPFTITRDPENGTIEIDDNGTPEDLSDNIYRYIPSENFNGTDTFIYSVCDIDEDCDTAFVTITVLPVNDAPVATNLRGSVDPAVSLIVDLSTAVSDVDAGTAFSYNVISSPDGSSASISSAGELNYTPTADNTSRRDTIIYEVCDNGTPALCSRGIVSVTVPDAVNTDEDMEVTFTISADDLDPSSIKLLVEPKNGDAAVDESKNGIVYTPNENFSGEDSIRYTYCNNSAICDTAWILFIVNPVNDAPIANNVISSVDPSVELLIDLSEQVTDIDVPTEFTYRVVSTPGDSKASINTEGILSFTPSESRNPRRDTVLYEVCDNGIPQLCATALVIITVPDAVNTNEDTAVEFEVFGEDIDTSSIALLTDPLYGTATLNNSTGIILYTPEENYNGFDSIRYTFCNQAGDVCDTTWLVYLVSAVNDAPVISNEFHTIDEDIQVSGNLLSAEDYDIEDTDLTIGQILLQPAHGTLEVNNNGTYTYTPALNYNGNDIAVVNICDSGDPLPAQCVGDTIFITINPVNDAPVTVSDNFIAGIGKGPLRESFNTNNYDVENSTIVFSRIIRNTTHGVFLPEANGNFVYTVSESAPGVIDTAIVEICESPSSPSALCSFDTIFFDIKQYLFISEGFTPNNDGNNDFFWVETLIPGNINLEVFNRWGTLVYSNSNYTNNWFGISNVGNDNGNTVPDGTYYYQITFGNGEVRRNYITILK